MSLFFYWISNLCIQSNFAMCLRLQLTLSIFNVILSIFFCKFLISSFLSFFLVRRLFFLVSSFALWFVLVSRDINESLIEQKITSIQSDACFKRPVDKKLISIFDAELKWIRWGANNCHCSYPASKPHSTKHMETSKREERRKWNKICEANIFTEF